MKIPVWRTLKQCRLAKSRRLTLKDGLAVIVQQNFKDCNDSSTWLYTGNMRGTCSPNGKDEKDLSCIDKGHHFLQSSILLYSRRLEFQLVAALSTFFPGFISIIALLSLLAFLPLDQLFSMVIPSALRAASTLVASQSNASSGHLFFSNHFCSFIGILCRLRHVKLCLMIIRGLHTQT